MDARLLRLREADVPWYAVADEMQLGKNTVIERARRLGLAAHHAAAVEQEDAALGREPNDESLPAGHPISWGALAGLTPSIDARWPNRT